MKIYVRREENKKFVKNMGGWFGWFFLFYLPLRASSYHFTLALNSSFHATSTGASSEF
jgi:hypothetical protein